MVRSIRAVLVLAVAASGAFALVACDLDQKTYLAPNRAQVEQSRYDAEVPVGGIDDNFYKALAQEYKTNGGGQLYMTFVYNPESGGSSAMTATELAGRASRALRQNGVSDAKVDIMPVVDSKHSGKVLISYTRYAASAPKDCKTMPGLEDTKVELGWDYQYGCSIEGQIAKQIARPRDLMGNDTSPDTSSGRRAAATSGNHEAGVPNEKLDAGSITDEGK